MPAAHAAAIGVSAPNDPPSNSSPTANTKNTPQRAPSNAGPTHTGPATTDQGPRPSTSHINPNFTINRGPNNFSPDTKANPAPNVQPGGLNKPGHNKPRDNDATATHPWSYGPDDCEAVGIHRDPDDGGPSDIYAIEICDGAFVVTPMGPSYGP